MTVCNILDLISTYYVSPTLEFEGNKWVTLLSLNFTGLIVLLVIMQVLNMIPLWFLCFKFITPPYEYRSHNSLLQMVKIYFFRNFRIADRSEKIKSVLAGIIAYIGFAIPLIYILSKILVCAENAIFGYLLRRVSITNKTNDNIAISIDNTDPFWTSVQGKSLLTFFVKYSWQERLLFQNIVLGIFGTFLFLYYVRANYIKAIRTPIVQFEYQKNQKEMQTWILVLVTAVSIFILT